MHEFRSSLELIEPKSTITWYTNTLLESKLRSRAFKTRLIHPVKFELIFFVLDVTVGNLLSSKVFVPADFFSCKVESGWMGTCMDKECVKNYSIRHLMIENIRYLTL